MTLGKVAKADYTPEGLVCDQCAAPVISRNGWARKTFSGLHPVAADRVQREGFPWVVVVPSPVCGPGAELRELWGGLRTVRESGKCGDQREGSPTRGGEAAGSD